MKYERQIIMGQPPSKSNLNRVVRIAGHGAIAKTKAVREYEAQFMLQCSLRGRMITEPFKITLDVYFKSNLPDLDNSLKVIFDCLQRCGAIKNDRLCMEINARKLVSKTNPRVEFEIETLWDDAKNS